MRGGVLKYAAQATSQIDAEIGKKDHFWMETILYNDVERSRDVLVSKETSAIQRLRANRREAKPLVELTGGLYYDRGKDL